MALTTEQTISNLQRRLEELERDSRGAVREAKGGGANPANGWGFYVAANKTALDAITPDAPALGFTTNDTRYFVRHNSLWKYVPLTFTALADANKQPGDLVVASAKGYCCVDTGNTPPGITDYNT